MNYPMPGQPRAAIIFFAIFFVHVLARIDNNTLDDLKYYSQYAAAAYCDSNTNPDLIAPGQALSCVEGQTCPSVEKSAARYLSSIYNYGIFSLTSVLAYDPSRDSLVLSFRGAEKLGVLTQIPMTFTPCTIFCEDCTCWTGFYAAWLEVRDQTIRQLRSASTQYPNRALTVTGHSLGAIMAVYAAGELRANASTDTSGAMHLSSPPTADRIALYTYGQPRSGNSALAATLSTALKGAGNFRVTHTDDPAPRMGDLGSGFRHLSPEYWISSDASLETFEVVDTERMKVLEGFASLQGNGGTGGYDVPAHTEYFQAQLGGCSQNVSRLVGLPYWLGGTVGSVINGSLAA